jgi:hypothetical protein
MLYVVSNYQTIQEFKKSRYFKTNLGLVATVEKNGKRSFNPDDTFSFSYNQNYNTTILGQGNVGNIKFYVDHAISNHTFAVYTADHEEFIFDFDKRKSVEKGIDLYLGFIIKTVEEEYEERIKNNELKKIEARPLGNADAVFTNPGNVSYEDVKEYLKNKDKNRY